MPNQYTKATEANGTESAAKVKFTVLLAADQREDLVWLSNHFRMDSSTVFRNCIVFLKERLTEFKAHYPNHDSYGLALVLKAYYDAGKQRLEEERAKEIELMRRYQEARERDGGRVNYTMDNLALAFHVRAWHSGRSAAEVLEEFAKQKAELGKRYGIDWHDDPWLRNFMQTGQADANPNGTTQPALTEGPTPDPDAVKLPVAVGMMALALLVGLVLGGGGVWVWWAFR